MDRRKKYFCIYHDSYTYDDDIGNCAACGAPRGAKASPSAAVDYVRERGAGLKPPSDMSYSMSPSVSASPSMPAPDRCICGGTGKHTCADTPPEYYAVWDSK